MSVSKKSIARINKLTAPTLTKEKNKIVTIKVQSEENHKLKPVSKTVPVHLL